MTFPVRSVSEARRRFPVFAATLLAWLLLIGGCSSTQQIETSREFLELHPDDPAAGNAFYWLGKIYFARGDFQQAAIAYAEGYQKFPEGPKAELTLLNLAQSLGKLGKSAEACASLEQLDVQFPNAGPTVRGEATATREQLGCG